MKQVLKKSLGNQFYAGKYIKKCSKTTQFTFYHYAHKFLILKHVHFLWRKQRRIYYPNVIYGIKPTWLLKLNKYVEFYKVIKDLTICRHACIGFCKAPLLCYTKLYYINYKLKPGIFKFKPIEKEKKKYSWTTYKDSLKKNFHIKWLFYTPWLFRSYKSIFLNRNFIFFNFKYKIFYRKKHIINFIKNTNLPIWLIWSEIVANDLLNEIIIDTYKVLQWSYNNELNAINKNNCDMEGIDDKPIDKLESLDDKPIDKLESLDDKSIDKLESLDDKPIDKLESLDDKSIDKLESLDDKSIDKLESLDDKSIDKLESLDDKSIDKLGSIDDKSIDKLGSIDDKSIDIIDINMLVDESYDVLYSLIEGFSLFFEILSQVIVEPGFKIFDYVLYEFNFVTIKNKLHIFQKNVNIYIKKPTPIYSVCSNYNGYIIYNELCKDLFQNLFNLSKNSTHTLLNVITVELYQFIYLWCTQLFKTYFLLKITPINFNILFLNNLIIYYLFNSRVFLKKRLSRGKNTILYNLPYVLILIFYLKELGIITVFLKTFFEQLHFSQHKRMLYIINFLICHFSKVILNYYRCKGFYICFRGKLGVGGNARKRNYKIKLGDYSLNTLNKRLKYSTFSIWTITGTVGVKIVLTY